MLLYRQERAQVSKIIEFYVFAAYPPFLYNLQYAALMANEIAKNYPLSSIYGAEHLIRFLGMFEPLKDE